MTALILPVLLGMAGLAVDAGNLYLAHSRLQAAADAGALAGALKLPFDPNLTGGTVNAAVTSIVNDNMNSAVVDRVYQGSEVRSLCVECSSDVDLMFMGVLGVANPNITASACAGFNNLEIVLVLDCTGSMKGDPIEKVKQASADLVNLVLPDGGAPSTKVGIVPFRSKVRIDAGVDGLAAGCRNVDGTLDTGPRSEYKNSSYVSPRDARVYDYGSYWKIASRYRTYGYLYTDTCSPIPMTQALSTNKSEILSSISAMNADGNASGTIISEGLKWGRHVLTPESPFTEGSTEEDFRKILILLTDGDTEDGSCGGTYSLNYSPNAYWTNAYYNAGITDCHCNDGGCLNQAVLDEAQTAKNEGIEIFTIRYGSSDYVDVNLMQAIASSKEGTNDHYYDAPTSDDIDDIFKEIGQHLGWRLLN